MATLTIYGYVDSDGTILKGSGFKTVHDDTGVYTLMFDNASDGSDIFNDTPVVVVSQVYTGEMSYGGGDVTDNALVIALAIDRAKILTGNKNDNHQNRQFTFIAVGPSDYADIGSAPLAK